VLTVVIVGGIATSIFSTVFHRAYVTVSPYRYEAVVSSSFQSMPSSETLPYTNVSMEDTVTKIVPASGTEAVADRASGTIIVYNAYSVGGQRLIATTRFQTKGGLVYRVRTPITVPGYTMKASVKVPGQIEATVYADQAGEKYNTGVSDFTLPGLTDPTQARLIYAKSKTPMAGGFVGTRAVVDPMVRADTVRDLQGELDRKLRASLSTAAPAGAAIFPDTVSLVFTSAPDVPKDDKNATISVSASASAPAFPLTALAKEVAGAAGIEFSSDLTIENPNDLSVKVDPAGAAVAGGTLVVSVSGTARLVGIVDAAALASQLAGKSGKDISIVRVNYPGIETLNVKVYPFWRAEIPKDPSRVKVTVQAGG
jgi:hypothetical protein